MRLPCSIRTATGAPRPSILRLCSALDFDLRISAARIKWRTHPLTDAAIELIDENGRLTATLVEATAYEGLLKAEITFAPSEVGL